MRKHIVALALAFVAGAAVGAASLVWAKGQAGHPSTVTHETYTVMTGLAGKLPKPQVLDNEAMGLRVEGRRNGRVVGTLVAKVDGKWVDVQLAPQDSLAHQ